MKNEVWKDIEGYEGLYQISNLGRVKSLKRKVKGNKNQGERFQYERIMKQTICSTGYYSVTLKKDTIKTYKVHRLIAQAFIPNPNNYLIINHKDGNKLNNDIYNLEWCTYSHNVKEAYKMGLCEKQRENSRKRFKECNKKINKYTKDGQYICTYNKMTDALFDLGINEKNGVSNISNCCKGIRKSAFGYKWSYK